MKLTEEQSEKVGDNHNLIYGFIRDYGLDVEEWYGFLAIELCKAVIIHDENVGELSTLFYKMASNALFSQYRSQRTQSRYNGGLLSLEYEYIDDSGEIRTFEDIIGLGDDEEIEDMVTLEASIDNVFVEEYKEIIGLRLQGYTQSEIGEFMGVTQQYISGKLLEMREIYKREMGGDI